MVPTDQNDQADQSGPARGGTAPRDTATVRLGSLSLPARLTIALGIGGLAVFAAWHAFAAFLFVAPSNTITKDHGPAIRGYIYPEFEQNWKLFAPNPLQRNVAVEVRAELTDPADGSIETTDWMDLTAIDVAHIRHQPLPSHTAQNELRRAWDFYVSSHDEDGAPRGLRGELSEQYVNRIALLRLSENLGYDLDTVERIQLRSATTRVPAPAWSEENIDTTTGYQELEWRTVRAEDLPGGGNTQ
ncbi:DUF5819 family protein [Streptomyces xiamenensis]|uniref:Membrane protein n=1 Tax=Streptomyces xiamenensis TaxID=408015 RepID=A0A0F7CP76_9ACTN|nr:MULTISPECIES: DUF5819 family protein [Streptomyces]AKG44176.1 membrane protein [Streptomyces xiamenensis]